MSDYNCKCDNTYPNGLNAPIPPFWGFSAFTPTIPKLYWDVKSQEQRILNLFDLLNKLVCYADNMGAQIDINADDIATLKSELQNLKDGGLLDYYEQQIYDWIQTNMASLLQASIRQVYFGLTDDTYSGGAGYFVAYIPDSWSDIVFDTGANPDYDTYGRLILRWDADSPYNTDQQPEYSYYSLPNVMEKIIAAQNMADNAMSLAETNEHDILLNEIDITALQTKLENVDKIASGSTYDQIADTGYLYNQKEGN